jgi:hypothetical protein
MPATVANFLNEATLRANYLLPKCESYSQIKIEDAYLVVNTCQGLVTIQNTLEKKRDPNHKQDWFEYATPVVFILAMGATGYYQYNKLTGKKISEEEKRAEEKFNKAKQEDPAGRTSSLNRNWQNSDSDDNDLNDPIVVKKNKEAEEQKQLIELQDQITNLEGKLANNLGGMQEQLGSMTGKK